MAVVWVVCLKLSVRKRPITLVQTRGPSNELTPY